eukprot:11162967-Lingulodinium_polyedra.AAC.1
MDRGEQAMARRSAITSVCARPSSRATSGLGWASTSAAESGTGSDRGSGLWSSLFGAWKELALRRCTGATPSVPERLSG